MMKKKEKTQITVCSYQSDEIYEMTDNIHKT